jgi:hypothetical protein
LNPACLNRSHGKFSYGVCGFRCGAFTRIDGAVDVTEDDWSLMIDGMSAARIYRGYRRQGRRRLEEAQPPHEAHRVTANNTGI